MIAPPRLPALETRKGWEMRWQLTLIEPAEPPNQDFEPKPRLNLVISVIEARSETPLAAAHEFIEATASAVRDLQHAAPTEIAFADGSPGAKVDLSFPATADVRLRQIHLFRLDAATLSQLVITGEDQETKESFAEIERAALQFRPDPATDPATPNSQLRTEPP